MRHWSIGTRITVGFGVVLIGAAVATALLFVAMSRANKGLQSGLNLATRTAVPVAVALEREILNARVHFIYFLTVQRPGALEQGWERYRNAQSLLAELVRYVETQSSLAELRPRRLKLSLP